MIATRWGGPGYRAGQLPPETRDRQSLASRGEMSWRRLLIGLGLLGASTLLGACFAEPETAPPPAPLPLVCGDERPTVAEISAAVVNGEPTWAPEVVALSQGQALAIGALLTSLGGGRFTNICTGTLVSPTRVVTAAHCVVDERGKARPATDYRFGIGPDVSRPVARYRLAKLHVHPEYDPDAATAAHDIAVLELTEPASAQAPGVEPIPYNCQDIGRQPLLDGQVQNVGYGATDLRGRQANSLQLWAVQEVSALSEVDFTVNGHYETGVCYGDSGGPSLWPVDGIVKVIGTLSWGQTLCAGRDHYVRVDRECAFLDGHVPLCAEIPATGRCEGTMALRCEGERLIREDCATSGQRCGADGLGRQACIPDPCGDETLAGRCEGPVAIWCAQGVIHHDDCATRDARCLPDAQGRQRCQPDPCGAETFAGRCDGQDAVWCEEGTIQRQPCQSPDEICEADRHGEHRCRPDPCQGETLLGRCAGNTAIWCEAEQVRVEECEVGRERCAVDSTSARRCLPAPCQGETLTGRCDGDDAVWCADETVQRRRCADCGQRCGFSVPHAAFYCVDETD